MALGSTALGASAGGATVALVEDNLGGTGAYVSAGPLRSELSSHNLTPQTLTRPITPANLSGVRFVGLTGLTVSYGKPYSAAEIEALVTWVKAGGALFLDGDWYSTEQFGPIAGPNFGITFDTRILRDPTDNYASGGDATDTDGDDSDTPVIHVFADHPIAEGLESVMLFRGVSIADLKEGAVAVARADGDSDPADAPVLASVVKGSGRVVAITDGNAVNGWGVTQPFDNARMLKNIVSWLLGDLPAGQEPQGDLPPDEPTAAPSVAFLEGFGVTPGYGEGEIGLHGLTVGLLKRPVLPEALTGVRLVVLNGNSESLQPGSPAASPGGGFSAKEVAAISDFVQAGGSLFVVADFTQYGVLEAVTGPTFGIHFDGGIIGDPTDNVAGASDTPVIHLFADHPVASAIQKVSFFRGVSMRLDAGAVAVATTDGDSVPPDAPVVATVIKGTGRVAAITDGNALSGGFYPGYDNAQLLKNLVAWLLGELEAGQEPQGDLPPGSTTGARDVALLEDLGVAAGYVRTEVRAHGLRAEPLVRPIDNAALSNARLLALTGNSAETKGGQAFSVDEIAAVADFVKNGGALLVVADFTQYPSLEPVTGPNFGIHYDGRIVEDPTDRVGASDVPVIHVFADHPITVGLHKVFLNRGVSMRLDAGAVWAARTDGDSRPANATVLATVVTGSGRVAAITDGNALDAGFFQGYDNPQALKNIVAWLLGELPAGQAPAVFGAEPPEGPLAPAPPTQTVVETRGTATEGAAPVLVLISLGVAALQPSVQLWAATVLLVPLFTRLRKDDVRNQVNRGRLLQFIADHPGVGFTSLRHGLGMSNGACAYHLQVLERSGEIRRVSQGTSVRFYTTGSASEVEVLPPLSYFQRHILEVLLEKDSDTFGSLATRLRQRGFGLTDKNLGYHLKVLTREKGLVCTRREGRRAVYFIDSADRRDLARRLAQEARVDEIMEAAAGPAFPQALETVALPLDPVQPRRSPYFIPDGQALGPGRYGAANAE